MTFCSRASIAAHEQFAGTGVRGRAYVFLPVPKRLWHDKEMNSHWASREELQAVQAARRAGVVVRLYNPAAAGEAEAPIRVHVRGEGASSEVQALLDAFKGRWRVDASGAPRLAVCTHGTRDRCCAKYGFAAFQAARRLHLEGASPFEPMECSHLGGDRFAATGIFFPSGSMYAHLDEAALASLCAAEAGGRIEPAHYRGGVFDAQHVQLARAGLARDGLFNDTAAELAVTAHGPDELEVAAGGERFHVWLKLMEVEFFGSCSELAAAKPSRGRRMVYDRAERIAETVAP